MIILDTNIVSEPMKPAANNNVLQWLDKQLAETLFLTTTSLAELLVGIEILPDGKRKIGLDGALKQLVSRLFASRILSFDQAAAEHYAPLISRARSAGYSIAVADGQIAAIAATHGFVVATRDTAPFVAAGIATINPWHEG
ncbi:VapC toxin family PIN domain ribonuclease [Rhizobium sp. JAB6]|uniref:type II toxin-antitoxin system VapC family toxin n=1 Tax=Rhizobium sp. JAB6 TaxID=2127050 RepID=UPI000D1170C3|nr:type II toxin-antitoxin system VapC family toxin [Rhizobium sp. JAB6]PST19264.1 VapC toxin family PIN domain ribonuclease [Rhizobium sp. JAB6]